MAKSVNVTIDIQRGTDLDGLRRNKAKEAKEAPSQDAGKLGSKEAFAVDRRPLSEADDQMEWRNEVPKNLLVLCPTKRASQYEPQATLRKEGFNRSRKVKKTPPKLQAGLKARNVYLTNLRMTQKRAEGLMTRADREDVVHEVPMHPKMFEAKILAAGGIGKRLPTQDR